MKELTLEIVESNAMNAVECVQWYWPNVSNSQADFIIWEMTAFPFSKGEMFLNELQNLYKEFPDISTAIPNP